MAKVLGLFLILITTAACSSVRPRDSGRHGLLDDDGYSYSAPRASRSPEHRGAGLVIANSVPAGAVARKPSSTDLRKIALEWPLKKTYVTSPFGHRKRDFHEGVDLEAHQGTPVYAAHSGKVLYAAEKIGGYGKMIILRHSSSGISTVYAHNSKLLVHKGQWVRQGYLIAKTGRTGHVTGPHLHFEVRSGYTAVDPIKFLPSRRAELVRPPGRRVSSARTLLPQD